MSEVNTNPIYRAIHSANGWDQKDAFDALDALVAKEEELRNALEGLLMCTVDAGIDSYIQTDLRVAAAREALGDGNELKSSLGPYNDPSCPPDTDNH